jgi:CheY-like chemotaxis protein
VIRLVLERHGYCVTVAAHGGEALEYMRESKPDLVLADVRMPFVGGRELVRRMRSSAELRSIPVGLLSGDLDAARSNHAADFVVVKPFDQADLITAIEKATEP